MERQTRTPKQIEAARRNGAKSRGPVTPEGKARVAQNAITHGLNTRVVVLSGESSEAFQELLDHCLAEYQPANRREHALVQDLAASIWRLNRTLILESRAIDLEVARQRPDLADDTDEADRATLAVCTLSDNSRALAWLSRHEGRLRRAIRDARAELEKCKSKPGATPGRNPLNRDRELWSRDRKGADEPAPKDTAPQPMVSSPGAPQNNPSPVLYKPSESVYHEEHPPSRGPALGKP